MTMAKLPAETGNLGLQFCLARRWCLRGLTTRRYKCIGNVIRASRARGVIGYRVRALVNIDVSSFLGLGGSRFSDQIRGLRARRGLAFGLPGLSGFGSPAGDSRGSRGSTGASIHSHGRDEGGLSVEDECLWYYEWLMMCV